MKLPYAAFQRQPTPLIPTNVQYRPLAPLRVIGPAGDLFFHALLDTGADYCVLPKAVATQLGVTLSSQPQTALGAGGHAIQVVSGSVDLVIAHAGQAFQWSATVGFADSANQALLGHIGCLDYFYASFDPDMHEAELVPTRRFPGTIHHASP